MVNKIKGLFDSDINLFFNKFSSLKAIDDELNDTLESTRFLLVYNPLHTGILSVISAKLVGRDNFVEVVDFNRDGIQKCNDIFLGQLNFNLTYFKSIDNA